MADLSVKVCGVDFKNPIIPASGVFGYGREYEDHNRVADAVRRNPDCLKKAVYLTDFSELLSEAEMRGVRPEELIGLMK